MFKPALVNKARSHREHGLSLVELMIAMALGLVLTFGVIQIFTAASQTYRLTDRVGQLQEDMRFLLGRLQSAGRMAGHYGCLIGNPTNNLDQDGDGFTEVSYGNRAVTGWEASDTGIGDAINLADALTSAWGNGPGDAPPVAVPALAGTDYFVINTAERVNVGLTGIAGTQVGTDAVTGVAQGAIVLLVSGDCQFGDLFQKANAANAPNFVKGTMAGFDPGNVAPAGFLNDGRNYADGANAYQYQSTLYFVGNGANGPGLFRQRLDTFGAAAQELVSGVENMQVLYGVSTGTGASRADEYVTAAQVTDWGRVVSMRVGLLMRSNNPVQDVPGSRSINLLGVEVTTPNDRFARLVGTTTIAIRNRLP